MSLSVSSEGISSAQQHRSSRHKREAGDQDDAI
jgi:hypothetical protein